MDANARRVAPLSIGTRLFVVTSSVLVWTLGFFGLNPAVERAAGEAMRAMPRGPALLVSHVFVFTLPTALLCGIWLSLLIRWQLVEPISFAIDGSRVRRALVGAAAIVGATVLLSPLLGLRMHLHLDGWSIVGNVFSNAYEELIYRGLLLFAVWSAFRNRWIAIVLSGAVFGLTHYHYPWMLRAYVAAVGVVLGWLAASRRDLATPYLAHDLSDWVLDALF